MRQLSSLDAMIGKLDNGLKTMHWEHGQIAKRIDYNLQQGQPLLSGLNAEVFTDMKYLTPEFLF